jgi:hypothetical protein
MRENYKHGLTVRRHFIGINEFEFYYNPETSRWTVVKNGDLISYSARTSVVSKYIFIERNRK